jgi:hypothetical protein
MVILQGRLPKPARIWHILADRSDGHGLVHIGTVAGAKYTDHHALPAKPAIWTYTVELRDKFGTPPWQSQCGKHHRLAAKQVTDN